MDEWKYKALEQISTPFYVFNTDMAVRRVENLRMQMPEQVELCYAVKANPFLIQGMESAVDHFEVCSPGEFRICERAGIDLSKVVLSGVYKSPEDVEYVISRQGDKPGYTAESSLQWELLGASAQAHRVKLRVLLRLSNGSQFGMDPKEIKELIRTGHPWLEPIGIHYFTGTQKKKAKRILRELDELDEFLCCLEAELGWKAQYLEYGPGLPASYFEGEEDAAPEIVRAIAEKLQTMRWQGKVTLEMGRYFAACSGTYATRIVDIKSNLGNRYCIVDGGIHQVNYYGQLLATKRPPVTCVPKRSGEEESYTVCGALCTTNDILLKEFQLADPQCGDALLFDMTGAYSPLEGIALFLSRDLPQIALYSQKDGLRLVRGQMQTDPLNGV